MAKVNLPSTLDFYNPVLKALHKLGGEADNDAIDAAVIADMDFSQEQLASAYESGKQKGWSRVIHRIAFARSGLKIAGLVDQPRRRVWRLTAAGRKRKHVETAFVRQAIKDRKSRRDNQRSVEQKDAPPILTVEQKDALPTLTIEQLLAEPSDWRAQLFNCLYNLTASQLEAFFQRIFADYGAGTVEIMQTDRKRGIDGLFTISGVFDMRICFRFVLVDKLLGSDTVAELHRYAKGSGADRAVLMTTGKFTEAALRDAVRASGPKVQLIDGEQLASLMQEQGMGVRSEQVLVWRTVIDEGWFAGL